MRGIHHLHAIIFGFSTMFARGRSIWCVKTEVILAMNWCWCNLAGRIIAATATRVATGVAAGLANAPLRARLTRVSRCSPPRLPWLGCRGRISSNNEDLPRGGLIRGGRRGDTTAAGLRSDARPW